MSKLALIILDIIFYGYYLIKINLKKKIKIYSIRRIKFF